MTAISYKIKKPLLVLAKVLVLSISFGYIFYKINNAQTLTIEGFAAITLSKGPIAGYVLMLALLFAVANWYFEIRKWQTLVSTFKNIRFKTAMKQSLASLTVSLATPNRIGEYGAKALFFEAKHRKKVLLLNFYSGSIQMITTSIFGIIGLLYLFQKFNLSLAYKNIAIFGCIATSILGLGYYFRKRQFGFKGFSILKAFDFFKKLCFSVKLRVFLYSVVRYLVFSALFYGLLLFFGAKIGTLEALLLIYAMYFLVSILPTFFIFDVVIRSGIAVWVFSFAGVPELTVLATVLAMWLLNFVLPALVGSFYVATYQPSIS
ncbi:lysylphosphatidylglycerol synthase domain-containing protein [Aequorivita marina]|uniref:lysylphosphatidylglycerol synthase domain-containing protein n=1 Tax=Aequorivita marina TaxID=3073654 RepID=UPI00287572DA|nr:lysylphosphatidylglycerol synthase domain-containing protein [Aequorivita sp. S2608]MDS1299741.1 lysylphosphatidylglycerol synthase domain-containing protein [Aequorivita sp. S2608]